MPPSGTVDCSCDVTRIGILEVQGAFLEHKVALQKACSSGYTKNTVEIMSIRNASDIKPEMDGLIIPGGESTTISLFLRRNKMEEPLRDWIHKKHHVTWGTCAGMILLSKQMEHQKEGGQPTLGILDTDVSRNFFGRQVASFESTIEVHDDVMSCSSQKEPFNGVFIRAPAVLEVYNPEVTVLGKLHRPEKNDDVIVAIRQENVLATAFHPELTADIRWHVYFLQMVENYKRRSNNTS
ncbi:hypothetical protein FSP39_017430 [Pinctada imbricata]|uniref:glutaminase n=1 Tax=Pinctada imbricata TaxID=66713 RepID=A0AA88YRQ9_PINIB|nr:hypothetical protein FSP39_017430 [Pinctada imbricata]